MIPNLQIDCRPHPTEGHLCVASIDDIIVGTARKGDSPASTHIADAWVEPNHRRQGIATAMYNAIERELHITLTPNPYSLSENATAFWRNRTNRLTLPNS